MQIGVNNGLVILAKKEEKKRLCGLYHGKVHSL